MSETRQLYINDDSCQTEHTNVAPIKFSKNYYSNCVEIKKENIIKSPWNNRNHSVNVKTWKFSDESNKLIIKNDKLRGMWYRHQSPLIATTVMVHFAYCI